MHEKFISGKTINLRDVEVSDAEFILRLRCDEDKSKFLHKTQNDLQKQIDYIKNYKTKEQEWYFIIENKSGEQLGTVRIYDVKDNTDFCWGSWLIKNGAPTNTGIESALLIYEYAFYQLGFTKVHFDVRKDNLSVRKFHERFGAQKVDENDLDVFYTYSKEGYENIRNKYLKFLK